MAQWTADQPWGRRVTTSAEWPRAGAVESSAIIVVNAARDHEATAMHGIDAGMAVLVEKPIARNAAGARRLAQAAGRPGAKLAPAQIFLFASYVRELAARAAARGAVRAMRIEWTDPRDESRYGEPKHYDASLPIFADWLPHVLSIIAALVPRLPDGVRDLRASRGGAELEFVLAGGDAPCVVHLVRNADRRRRIVEVETDAGRLRLDFTSEPGILDDGTTSAAADSRWADRPRPSASMLDAFLRWAAGGSRDARFGTAAAVRACELSDAVTPAYRAVVVPWLVDRLANGSAAGAGDDVRYALSELLQRDAAVPADALDAQIDRVRRDPGYARAVLPV
jgi:predicted dehydrogenase